MSVAIFSRGNFEITGVPSFAAITAFGPLETIVADTGIFSAAPMSATLMPWFARFTTTRTPSARPSWRASSMNCELLRIDPISGVTTSRISFARVSITIVRSA